MLNRLVRFLICSVLLVEPVAGQVPDTAKLNRYFRALDSTRQFIGSVAIARKGVVLYTAQAGFSDVAHHTRPDSNTSYRIGSISKMFTTVLLFKAIDQHLVELGTTLDKFFPAIANAPQITISDMLSHRSGIRNFTDDPSYVSWNTKPVSEDSLLARITRGRSVFPPGTKAAYSNSNFVLLGMILSRVFRQPYRVLLEEKIVRPLHLAHTYYGKTISPADNEAYSYHADGEWKIEAETDMSVPGAAGAVVSTPADLVRFADALFNGVLLPAADLEKMETVKEGYGRGLFAVPFYNRTGYGHDGSIDGFRSVLYHFADGDISIAVTANGVAMNTNDISIVLLSAAYQLPFSMPDFHVPALTASDLELYTGTYRSAQLPMKITVTSNGKSITAQATAQAPFPLVPMGNDRFSFTPAGIFIEFQPGEHTMILKQGVGVYNFSRE